MKATALEARPVQEYALFGIAVLLSMLVHCAGAVGAASIEAKPIEKEVWVEMMIIDSTPEVKAEPTPEPEPEPEQPEPEPEPEPVPEPETVEFKPEPKVQPEPPPPTAKPLPRPVQGIDANSFAKGVKTGLSASHGNTTATKQTREKLGLNEDPGEFATVPFTSVTKSPRARYKPALKIPQEIIDDEVEGRVEILLDIDGTGKVLRASLVQGLHPAADAACLASMRRSRWKPGTKDGKPVITMSVPYSCRFEMAVD